MIDTILQQLLLIESYFKNSVIYYMNINILKFNNLKAIEICILFIESVAPMHVITINSPVYNFTRKNIGHWLKLWSVWSNLGINLPLKFHVLAGIQISLADFRKIKVIYCLIHLSVARYFLMCMRIRDEH